MSKQPDAYFRPNNLDEAQKLLAKPDFVPLGGGTKLLTSETGLPVAGIVDLQSLGSGLIEWQDERLLVGAMTRLAELTDFLATSDKADASPLLQNAIRQAGPNTYRNAATLGGTIASRLPDSELLAALLVLDARILFVDATGMPLADYLALEERPSQLITSIIIPWQAGNGRSERVARTPADYPIVSITLWEPENGRPKLSATGIAKRPLRLYAAEDQIPGPIENVTQAAQSASNHTGDFRGDAEYRKEMTAVLTRRILTKL